MKISVVIPCRNEREFIEPCLESVAASVDVSFDDIEVLVVDGLSDDGTREILGAAAERWPWIRVLENAKRIQSAALNIGIAAASGDVIVRLDAHNTYASNYLSACVDALARYGADNVGGIWKIVARDAGPWAEPIVTALSHPFGVGNATYRLLDEDATPRWVDTVPYFCCRREVFERLGPFSERVGPSEDMEFSLRLRKAGFRILLVPAIVSTYHARSTYAAFVRHMWRNGVWATLPLRDLDGTPVRLRHLVPLAFVGGLAVVLVAAVSSPGALVAAAAIAILYLVAASAASVHIAWRAGKLWPIVTMPFTFATLHLVYGVGSAWGLLMAARERLGRLAGAGKSPAN